MNYDEAIVNNFIHPNKQERYRALLANPKKRMEILRRLAHGQDLRETCMNTLPKMVQTGSELTTFLKKNGAGAECYLISENSKLDGLLQPLESAIEQIYGYGYGTILFCIPKGPGYFEGEGQNERYFLTPAKGH